MATMTRFINGCFAVGLGLSLNLAWAAERDREPPRIVVSSFRAVPQGFFEAPFQTQPKSLLEGAKAQPQPDGRYLVTEAKWTFFRTNGTRELELAASQCYYDGKEQSVSSPGPLSVLTADGAFAMTGEGFLWRRERAALGSIGKANQTNSVLFISNRVHTLVNPSLLQSATNRSATAAPADLQAVDIFSDRFQYETASELGIYDGHVRVAGTNLNLTASRLTLRLPVQERRVHRVLAEQDVVVDYAQIHATGQRADYSVDADVLEVTGQPTWRSQSWEGRADALTVDRTSQILVATGHTWLKIPSHGLGQTNLLSTLGSAGTSTSTAGVLTNQWVEIRSDRYERRPGSAVLNGGVNVSEFVTNQVKGTLDCGLMSLAFTHTNELQQVIAEQAVVIREGDRGFNSGKAVFSSATGRLELTDNPSWRAALREGKGDQILVQRDQMTVRGHASARLPVSEIAASSLTGKPSKPGSAKPAPPGVEGASTNLFVIESDEYLVSPQAALFQGGVRVGHPQMKWNCNSMAIEFDRAGRRAERLVAEPADFDLISDDGESLHGTGAKAIYTYNVSAARTNELVRLTGTPAVLSMTNNIPSQKMTNSFTYENDLIILNLANYTIQTPGRYVIHGVVEASDTNKFKLPSTKTLK